jgi:hypothetical protein
MVLKTITLALTLTFTIATLGSSFAGLCHAQTLHDPVPIQGNAVTESARSSAMYSAMTPGLARRTPEQNARRLADLEESKACRARALQYPAGHKMRRAIRDQCRDKLDLARANWK